MGGVEMKLRTTVIPVALPIGLIPTAMPPRAPFLPLPANFTTFIEYFKGPTKNNYLFPVPMESFIKTYLYRKDLFSEPDVQKAFKAKYGYDLAPPKDHKQYTDIAEFFTQWGKSHDMQLWGSTVQAHPGHPASWYE